MVGQGTTPEFWDYVMATLEDLPARSYYELLGIDGGATIDAIGEAYYSLLRRLHPDVHGAERNRVRQRALTRLTARLGEAYRTLADPNRRSQYDRGLAQGRLRLLAGADPGKSAGPQDPSSESARKLYEQGLEHLEVGELTRARAQLVLAKSFEPQSKAIVSAWDQLLEGEHSRRNEQRVARGMSMVPYESPAAEAEQDTEAETDGEVEVDDEDASDRAPTNLPYLPGMLDAGVAGPRDGEAPTEPRGPVRDDMIQRAVLTLGDAPARSAPDILRANALVSDADARVYDSAPTIPNMDATLDESLPDDPDDDIAVEIDTDDMVDADTMFEPADDELDESTQQVELEDMVSPPLRVRVKTWDQAAKLYVLVRDCKGLYIRSGKDAHIAQHVEVEVILPTEQTIMIGAIVRDVVLAGDHSGRQPGLGVEFKGIDDRNRAQIERLNSPPKQS